MQNQVTIGAKLRKIERRIDAQSLARWSCKLAGDYGDTLYDKAYQTTFYGTDLHEAPMLIGGAGRLLGMKVRVSRSAVIGEIDAKGRVVAHYEEKADGAYESIPFTKMFQMCTRLRGELKSWIGEEFYQVPFVGGIKSIYLSDEEQEIANYYLPEVEIFGDGTLFQLFTAERLDEPALPDEAHKESYQLARLKEKTDYPDRPLYRERMEKVLDILRRDEAQKVVVARKCKIVPQEGFDLFQFTAYELDKYYQEYFYLFRQGDEAYWTGISPEIIMKQDGRKAVTKPLAGTRKKSDDPAENEKIRQNLTSASKDIIEHEHALYFMENQLKSAGIGEVRIDKNKTVLETPYTFHIKSELSMDLNEGVSCFDVIGALYPPATVWGIPVDRTETILKETEPFAREYFTGVYGHWNFKDEADAALIIRSAKVEQDAVCVYAGGGIVKYSDIDSEFDETVNKMRPLVSYFAE